MIQQIKDLPAGVVGFDMNGEITKEDYERTIYPAVKTLSDSNGLINVLMVINTELKNIKMGAWFDDAVLGLKHLTQWHRVALVTNDSIIKFSTRVMNKVIPGEYKTFGTAQRDEAVAWVSG